jgi:hypothetical protein
LTSGDPTATTIELATTNDKENHPMAMTKAEAAKLTQDLLLRGVIETVIKESQLLRWCTQLHPGT